MEEPKEKRKISDKLKDRYRLVILNENTLENVYHAILSRLNFMVWIGLIGVFLVAIGIVLVSFTPLREYIPGYPDGDIRWVYMQNALQVDSLEHQINMKDQYINNIQTILRGNETQSYINNSDTIPLLSNVNFEQTDFDSVLRIQIDEEERYNISTSSIPVENKFEINKLHFYCPLNGSLTNLFDASGNHYGIDIASNLNEPILSVLDGTVVLAGWTLEAGYVIEVQHKNNLLSIYKHNSQLLKKMGDRVTAGEALAIIGNTGEYTTGPHLHFELWHDGKPLNPKDYIVF
ncbi:MAG: M23 family metallopeptidase [Salinivirgaceae bacterium]|nr:M23 family metallopeptidase [Salinivirgaceae bacterium]